MVVNVVPQKGLIIHMDLIWVHIKRPQCIQIGFEMQIFEGKERVNKTGFKGLL